MTLKQTQALTALLLGTRPPFPTVADLVDGCLAGGVDGRTPQGIAESMDCWNIVKTVTAQSAGRHLNALVRLGFAARVFLPNESSPRYVATKEGAAEHERRTPGACGHAKCRPYVRCIYPAKRGAEPWPEKRIVLPARPIRTWRVGEVGVEGTRLVEPGGVIRVGSSQRKQDRRADGSKWPRRRYQDDRLLPFVGQIVYFHDDDAMDNTIGVFMVEWLASGKAAGDRLICRAKEAS